MPNPMKTVFRIERLDCAAEEQLVRMSLDQVEGIETVAVDLDSRTVSGRALDALDLDTTQLADAGDSGMPHPTDPSLQRQVLRIALIINAGLFVAEFGAGLIGRSMGLLGDSLDMLADASVYTLSLMAVGRSVGHKKRLAIGSGYLQLALAIVGLIEVTRRFITGGTLPDVRTMILVSMLALAGNIATLVVL